MNVHILFSFVASAVYKSYIKSEIVYFYIIVTQYSVLDVSKICSPCSPNYYIFYNALPKKYD